MAPDDTTPSPRPKGIEARSSTTRTDLLAAVPGTLVTAWVGDIEGAFSPMSGCLDDAT
jgi:hypothetical protein